MRRMRVALTAVCFALAAGCGGEEKSGGNAPAALAYVPRDAFVVAVLPTDFEGAQLRRFGHLIGPTLRESGGGSFRDAVAESLEEDRVDFDRDIAPLLGGPLVIASYGSPDEPLVIAALETPDGEKAKALVAKLWEGATATVDGDTLLVSLEGEDDRAMLEAAIERRKDGDGLDGGTFAAAFGEDAGTDDALVQVFGDARTVARELDVDDVDVPWLKALRSVGLTVRLESDEIDARLLVRTDPDGLRDDDLPLAPGDDSPEAGDVDGAIASANRDQSHTTLFLAHLAREAYPNSRFVQEVAALESALGVSFEGEVLSQFNGPSVSVATPHGEFAAVSDVADPERMRALLPKLAPRLPPLLRSLQGLGNSGLVALLLFAPDAPLVPGALPALNAGIGIHRLPGEDLYEITGLDEESEGPEFAAPSVVFGMIGDRFVVATDEQRARAVTTMEVSEVEDAHGAAVARADVGTWSRETLLDTVGIATAPLGEATGELEASRDGIAGRLRLKVPRGLD